MKPKTHPFEGEQLTIAQICARVPAISERTVRERLKLGCDSRQRMLARDARAACARGGRKGRAAAEAGGKLPRSTTFWNGARARAAASGFVP